MIEKLTSFINSHQLFGKTDKLAVAVSGGKDSVCAAHLIDELNRAFCIVHCNFKLRAEESDNDEMFVRDLALNLKQCTDIYVVHFDTEEYASKNKLSIQEAARNLRYAYFKELHDKAVFDKIILGHHRDDELETFIINLYRGSGLKGLRSIPLKRDFIVRPLMAFRAHEIARYMHKNEITHREDHSNSGDKYLRNRIRLKVLPGIEETLPDFSKRAINSIQFLKEEFELFEFALHTIVESLVNISEDGEYQIDASGLQSYPQCHVILYSILDKLGFSMEQCKTICATSGTGKQFDSAKHRLIIDRDMYKIRELSPGIVQEILVAGEGEYVLGDLKMTIEPNPGSRFSPELDEETVDLDPALFPLSLRYWKEGDFIQPLGMKGTKLMSDFFIDQKTDLFTKHRIPLLTKGNEVLIVAGMRISDKIKIHNASKSLYKVAFLQKFDPDFDL